MRCLTWTPLSILGGPYFFSFTISLFSPDFGVQTSLEHSSLEHNQNKIIHACVASKGHQSGGGVEG